ncbi:hypothetical protein Srufu_004300 [Streptomyces libani subsp. rufus]|nr:hypothetical protein Srufu_004300 [Streptomyces libani subsp. rufus]
MHRRLATVIPAGVFALLASIGAAAPAQAEVVQPKPGTATSAPTNVDIRNPVTVKTVTIGVASVGA